MVSELIPQQAHRIIVAPLNWGLGHATRCIPIIKELLEAGKEVHLASDQLALQLLGSEFPDLTHHSLPAYNVQYKHQSLFRIMLDNGSKVLAAIKKEKQVCEQLVQEHQLDAVISDSRFGFRSEHVPSYIISHQLAPYSTNPLIKAALEKGNRSYLNKFDAVWVPDDPDHKLSGDLSKNTRIAKAHYLGPISRLQARGITEKIYDLSLILSGPEPARTVLEQALIKELAPRIKNICLVRGTQSQAEIPPPPHWTVYDLADSKTINTVLLQSKKLLSRSGYTSIMDYYKLGVGAYLIPTPGQSEQEYLAARLDGQHGFVHLEKLADIVA